MIGKVVLVGLTYRNEQEEITDIRQYFGVVNRINAQEGLVIVRGDNQQELRLPPRLAWYSRARPGTYHLKSSSYSVEDPDYVATLSVYPATPDGLAASKDATSWLNFQLTSEGGARDRE